MRNCLYLAMTLFSTDLITMILSAASVRKSDMRDHTSLSGSFLATI